MLAIEKSRDTFIAPIGIGLALFVSEIAGQYPKILDTIWEFGLSEAVQTACADP